MVVDFDPVAFSLGSLLVRWYGLAYMVGFLGAWGWATLLIQRFHHKAGSNLQTETLSDLLTWLIVAVIVGGRLGEVLFYHPQYYLHNPLAIIQIWRGGMSFHGAIIGGILTVWLFASRKKIPFLTLTDLVTAGVPIGLFLGRIANFINGELWGRTTDVPWGMIFPLSGTNDLRHPSPLYEAALEGLLLFALLNLAIFFAGALSRRGMVSGGFLLGYGAFRMLAEFFREPDTHIGILLGFTSWGQWLSLPMVLAGIALLHASGKAPRD